MPKIQVGKVYSVYIANQKRKRRQKKIWKLQLSGLFVIGSFAGASLYQVLDLVF